MGHGKAEISDFNHHEKQLLFLFRCGLVALTMGLETLHGGPVALKVEELLAEAKRRGFTKQGEMFSAFSMKDLARWALDQCKGTKVGIVTEVVK